MMTTVNYIMIMMIYVHVFDNDDDNLSIKSHIIKLKMLKL